MAEEVRQAVGQVTNAAAAVRHERVVVDQHDDAHGGRAVAEKALAWFIHSANRTRADFVAKVDDDSMVSLPRLVSELRAVSARMETPAPVEDKGK